MLVAGALAAAAGWSWWRTAAAPVTQPPSHARAAVAAPAPAPEVTSTSRAPMMPPGPLAAFPDPSARAAAAALLTQATDARSRGDLRTALGLLQAAVARAASVEAHAALGGLYLELGVAGPAESHLRTAVEGDPRNADRWIALANALALKPDPMAAADALERARAAMPGIQITRNADGWLVRASSS
jgi:Tfp pilus assembly protein PilF